MDDFKKILSKAISDPEYGNTLVHNPEEAIKQAGVESTPEKVAALREAVGSLVKTHKAFHGGTRPD
jgi:hypothetical protein